MTILRPHKESFFRFLLPFSILIVLGGLVCIYEYNSFVNVRYAMKDLKEKIADLETKNADLKNALYTAIDTSKLQDLANSSALVLDKHPDYLNSNQWLSASSL